MPTDTGTLATQIAALDARISEISGATQLHDGNTSASYAPILDLINARDRLQALYDRLTGVKRLAVRGRVVGLPGGCVSQGSYP